MGARTIAAWLAISIILGSSMALAQTNGAIIGVVKDQTGTTLPGVTVEASSPALIERVKTAVTAGSGDYQIVDLRPGAYDVTFTMPGFQTVKHEGITIGAAFTAAVNVVLRVGQLAETVIVRGEAPLVDVRTGTSERALNQQLLEGIPTGRASWALAMLMPGATTSRPDVGGSEAAQIVSFSIHGSQSRDVAWNADGLDITSNLGNTVIGTYYNQGLHEEMSIQTKALPAEVAVGGVNVNVITKEGGNKFRGQVFASFAGHQLQSSNVSKDQRERGLVAPSATDVLYDVNPGVGGPILRDKLWFYVSYRRLRVDRFEANTFNPDGTQALDEQLLRMYSAKLTYQVSPSNRLSGYIDYLDKIRFHRRDRTATYQFISPEAAFVQPTWGPNAALKWTSTVKSNFIIEAGFSYVYPPYTFPYQPNIAPDALPRNDLVLSTLTGAAPPPSTGSPGKPERRVYTFVTSWLPNWKGSHNLRTGVQFHHTPFSRSISTGQHGDIVARYRAGTPDSVVVYNTPLEQSQDLFELGVFAQDSWVLKQRLTVNAGVRLERLSGRINEQSAPAGTFVPAREFPRVDLPTWTTAVPRLAVAYNIFGNGKTVIKGNVSKYMQRQGSNFADSVNPLRFNSEIRSWNDANRDGIPQLHEIGPGRGELDRGATVRLSPDLERPYQWEQTVSLEQVLLQNFALTVSYYHRKYYRQFSTVNVALQPSDYVAVAIPNPLTGEPFTMYNQNPASVGRVDNVLLNSDALNSWYNGFEVTLNKRFANNFMVFGGFTAGANKECTSASTNPNDIINSCGYASLDSKYLLNVSGLYHLPSDVRVSVHFQHATGQPLTRRFVVTRAHVPNLTQVNQTVILVPRGDVRKQDQTLLDVRFSKIFAVGRGLKLEPLVELFNLTNENASQDQVEVVGPALGQVSRNIDGRIVKLGFKLTF